MLEQKVKMEGSKQPKRFPRIGRSLLAFNKAPFETLLQ
jgi:hypothetical protein